MLSVWILLEKYLMSISTTASDTQVKSCRCSLIEQEVNLSKTELTALELCAGAGGAALGLEQAGFRHTGLVEINQYACATLRSNRPNWNIIQADITSFDASDWHGIDLLSGGLPCPPFSIAGKQLGADDERNMFPSMLRIARETEPRAILVENVRGLMTPRFTPFRTTINRELDTLGFDAYWTSLNAADFGVPQNRVRVFLVALRRGVTKPLYWPIPIKGSARAVGMVLGDMMGARGWNGAADWVKNAASVAPTIVGGSHKHGGPDLGPTRARNEWAAMGVDGLGLANDPPGEDFTGMPRLTIQMVARLQGFPDNWEFSGSKTQAYRQVGNALPVGLAFHVAKAVRACLE
jgi:DNA (cytosine-5)-methyltransferase 1